MSTKSVCNSQYMVIDQHRTTGEQIKHSTLSHSVRKIFMRVGNVSVTYIHLVSFSILQSTAYRVGIRLLVGTESLYLKTTVYFMDDCNYVLSCHLFSTLKKGASTNEECHEAFTCQNPDLYLPRI